MSRGQTHDAAASRLAGPLGRALLLGGLTLGVWLRVDGFAESALFGDEFHTLDLAGESLTTIVTTFDDLGSHVVLPLLQHIAIAVFGEGAHSLRLPALIPGVLTLLLLFPIARSFVGRTPAILERHRAHLIAGQPQATVPFAAAIAAIVRRHLGPATYEDQDVLVWKL